MITRQTPPEKQASLGAEDIVRGLFIAVAVLGIGVVIGFFTSRELIARGTAYFVIAAGLGVVLAAVTYQKLELAMMAYIAIAWASVGATPDVATGTASGTGRGLSLALIGIAFLLFFWVLRGLTGRGISFVRSPLNVLLILYLAFNVMSALNGRLFWDPKVADFYAGYSVADGGRTPLPVVVFELVIRTFSVATCWLFANNLQDGRRLRRASWLLLVPGTAAFLGGLLRLPVANSSWAGITEVVLACTLFAWLIDVRPDGAPRQSTPRVLGWVLLVLIIFQVFYIDLRWVSGYLGLFVGLYFVAFLRSRRLFAAMLGAGIAFYFAVHALIAQVVHKVQTSGDMDRFSMVRGAFLYALHFPLGVGPGNYKAYNQFYGRADQWGTTPYTSDHNFYAQMLSETGFVGLLITLSFVTTALVLLTRFYRSAAPGWSRTFLLGICGMWAGISACTYLGDYLIPVYYNGALVTFGTTIYAWIGLGVGFAHARHNGLLSTKKRPTASSPSALPSAAEYYPRRLSRDPK